jgi:hypothetical protein
MPGTRAPAGARAFGLAVSAPEADSSASAPTDAAIKTLRFNICRSLGVNAPILPLGQSGFTNSYIRVRCGTDDLGMDRVSTISHRPLIKAVIRALASI